MLRRWISVDVGAEGLEDGYRWMEEQNASKMDMGGWRRSSPRENSAAH